MSLSSDQTDRLWNHLLRGMEGGMRMGMDWVNEGLQPPVQFAERFAKLAQFYRCLARIAEGSSHGFPQ